jgi:hypothetical protein
MNFRVYSRPAMMMMDAREVFVFGTDDKRQTFVIEPMVYKVVPKGSAFERPMVHGSHGCEFMQALLNHAWDIGLRPAGFNDAKLETGAIKYHLEDMRRLVFDGSAAPT